MFDVLGWINYLIDSIWNLIKAMFSAFFGFLGDIALYFFEELIKFGMSSIAQLLPDTVVPNLSPYWNSLPGQVISLLAYVKIPQALGMIVSAYTIRFIIAMIPFIK